jgi:RHS repeat-associated protein
VVKLSFSAYGERRDADWDGPITNSHLTSASNVTRHGYTDHLQLDSVKLVHMGGRVYDPVIGRFLSRDPYIDGVDSSQGANGYAYVWNNPLTRWDPTGFNSTIPGRDYRTWANHGQSEKRNDGELEEITVTGRQSYWELTSTLIAHEFRLALIGSGASGSGGELGGGGSGSGGVGGEPDGPKKVAPEVIAEPVPPSRECNVTAADNAGGMVAAGGTLAMAAEFVGEVQWDKALSTVGRNLGFAATLGGALIEFNDGNTTEAVISVSLGIGAFAAGIVGLPGVATGFGVAGLVYGVHLMTNPQSQTCQ